MRNAPSVSYPVGRSFLRTLLHAGVLVAVWLACGAWAMLARTDEVGRWGVGLACLLVTVFLVWALLRPARGRLRWDGQDWFWSDAVQAGADDLKGRLSVRLDWQSGMLLEFRSLPEDTTLSSRSASPLRAPVQLGHGRWLWVEQDQAPVYWNALRRAAWAAQGNPSRVPG
ncbi:hypothetical protein DW355_09280 [Hylemonella gracilis]|uniref:Uncharacterized protein n=1 Tax=Hylemonella gracilis TaxID=80880 RepID=A0A4V1A262_9BURK|nr:hypothetical protein [Hylemonella gracilis]QBK04939.1 hypothetical protein DW355_09280 [Hylemonella gracilis]